MQALHLFIKDNPDLTIWIFALVNAAWTIFTYFNRYRNERKLTKIRAEFDVETDRRKRNFERRAAKYEAYAETIDALSKRSSKVAISNTMKVVGDLFVSISSMLQSDPENREKIIVGWAENSALTLQKDNDAGQSVLLASNQLKLVASKEVLTAIAKVEDCQRKYQNITKEFFNKYGEIFKMGNQNMIKTYAEKFQTMDEEMQAATQKLINQMRSELII